MATDKEHITRSYIYIKLCIISIYLSSMFFELEKLRFLLLRFCTNRSIAAMAANYYVFEIPGLLGTLYAPY
jgi:hypothetical protein